MIKSTNVRHDKELLEITLEEGNIFSYPLIWLRDNCQCNSCCYAVSKFRKVALRNLIIDIHLDHVEVSKDGHSVQVIWPDGHQSDFNLDWLIYNRFTEDGTQERRKFHKLPVKIWGTEMAENMTKIDWNDLLEDDSSLYKWLKSLEIDGIALLQNAPSEERISLTKIAQRVNAWLRPQNEGDTFDERLIWNVRADARQHSGAYTSNRLNFHTDQSYFDYPPNVLMLHCLVQPDKQKGGDSIFADGFKAAKMMQELYPEYFKVLTTCPLYHYDIGSYYYKFHQVGVRPTIELDCRGELKSIVFAHHARHATVETRLEDVKTFYKAYTQFEKVIDDNHVNYKLKPGDIACVDNTRVLHGRLAFEMQPGEMRHIEGSYLEWDELRSARRVLDEKFKAV